MSDTAESDTPPSVAETAIQRRKTLARVIELHGLDSTFVTNFALVQACYVLVDLVCQHESINERTLSIDVRLQQLARSLAHLAETKPQK